MWRIGLFDFNRATGFFGMMSISIAITLLVFSAIYFSEGAGWAGAADEEGEDYDDIAANWYMGGIIYTVIGSILLVAGLVLVIVNKVSTRKGKEEGAAARMFLGIFDLDRISGILPLIMAPMGPIFILNGILYKREAWIWENTATKPWHFNEASAWHTSAMWMYLVAIFLLCGAAFLLVYNWRATKKYKMANGRHGGELAHESPDAYMYDVPSDRDPNPPPPPYEY